MNLLGFDIAEIPTVAVRQVITTDSCVGALALPLLLPGFRLRRGRFRRKCLLGIDGEDVECGAVSSPHGVD